VTRPIAMVGLDLDGTLVDSNSLEIGPRDRDALRATVERGVHVVIATARTPGVAAQFARSLGLAVPVIGNNGASAHLPDGSVLVREVIPADCATRIIGAIHPDSRVTWVEGDRIRAEQRADSLPGGRRRVGAFEWDVEVIPRASFPVGSAASAIGAFGGPVADLVSALRSEPVCALRYLNSEVLSGVIFIDAKASKGSALRRVAEHLGVPSSDVLAIGDSEADISMFEFAGASVAMADAPADVRAQATWTAPSQAQQGVATALERFVLAR
jgi:hydroxymethylpyrimidine pyrophosphatase-like HAD family hydrolase